jgi:hypothetical protein
MSEDPLRFPRLVGPLVTIAYLLVVATACVAAPALGKAACVALGLADACRGLFTVFGWLAIALGLAVVLRNLSGRPRRAVRVLVFLLLPIWGVIANHHMTAPCRLACPSEPYRALASPEVYGLLLLHVVAVGGYELSRRREHDMPARAEPWIVALLLCGVVLHVALAVQLLDLLPWLLFFPLSLPLLTPFLAVILFWRELARRLRAQAERVESAGRTKLLRGIFRLPFVLGAYALLLGFWRGHPQGALDVFARTCTHSLSRLPLELSSPQCGGHYLCTLAARGHPALVRPERLGIRRGRVIVVNRQLAVANAFEDLLHARWPRLGRTARTCYDRLAIPICRYIQPRWVASLVYLAMKPAEWLFYLALLAFDPHSPEARIDRMYR